MRASAASDGHSESLWDAFHRVPDRRNRSGRRYPLPGLLVIAVAALLSGRQGQIGIKRWGEKLSPEALGALGITRARVPAPSVWCEFFKKLDVVALEQVLAGWVAGGQPAGHTALDGKRLRGSRHGGSPGVHLVAAFSERLKGVIGELKVDPDANEITAALALLKDLPLEGVVITGDAIFAQKGICRTIIDRGGHYFFTVKGNQPALRNDIALAFRPDSPL